MSHISSLIRDTFGDYAVYKDKSADALFAGRCLPNYVKDFILNRFTQGEERDVDGIRKYLSEKMPQDGTGVMKRLLTGEVVNVTTRVIFTTDLADGRVTFLLPDLAINANMIVSSNLVNNQADGFVEGENWGNVTLQYMPPEGRRKGCVMMTAYKSFNPYLNVDFANLIECRKGLTIEEWIDVILATMGYDSTAFKSNEARFIMISRLLPMLESNLNFIELGPKASGKSFVYTNLSSHVRMISGKTTRAQLVYNHSTKQYGAIKYNDLIVFDEACDLEFEDRTQELQNFLRGYLEAGHAALVNVRIASTCGIGLVGNVTLTEELEPVNKTFLELLPDIFRPSAMLDRFHMFIPGWLLPKIAEGQLYYGWAIDNEVFAEYLHYLRTETYSEGLFDQLVEYDNVGAYVRHSKAVRKVATAYCKLLFPHVTSLDELTPEDLKCFKALYREYCLVPAVNARTYIHNELKANDAEYRAPSYAMPIFEIRNDALEDLPEELPEDLPEELPSFEEDEDIVIVDVEEEDSKTI